MKLKLLSPALWASASLADYTNYFPPPVEGLTVIHSKQNNAVTISYKKVEICDPSYSGYVHLPASSLLDAQGPAEYDANIFYWYFPARQSPETAPISIWIGGGPGESAIAGAMTENGPCYVNPDSNSTTKNPWSRNERVNMLYVDQPVGAGYSYNRLVNVTFDQIASAGTPTDFSGGIPFTPNITVFPGTLTDPNLMLTPNNSNLAAKVMWHFGQAWFGSFPFLPQNKDISLWTNSYGGFFGPAIFKHWDLQNKLIAAGKLQGIPLPLDTLGIENGCIDGVSQAKGWLDYSYNNTYGLQIINETVYNFFLQNITAPGGCISIIQQCRELAKIGDPGFNANNQTVNDLCGSAAAACNILLAIPDIFAGRSGFDIAQVGVQSSPLFYHVGFFNRQWVQRALGAPINFTDNANLAGLYFAGVGDAFRQDQSSIEHLLAEGIQVALVYGDRDSRCPWNGVENVSLTVNYPDSNNFRSAGYADLQTNGSYKGGVVRQYDGFSFTRVFEAGHAVSAFQPETASQIFNRVMFRKDIATRQQPAGYNINGSGGSQGQKGHGWDHRSRWSHHSRRWGAPTSHYQSKGPSSSFSIKNILPPPPVPVCNLWVAAITCTDDQLAAVVNGTAVTQNFLVTSPKP